MQITKALCFLAVSYYSASAATGPCDIYETAGTPCVAAHSTVRALYASYDGPLYIVNRSSDHTTSTIGVLSAGGFADSASQDTFCASSACTITRVFDQSPKGNHLSTGFGGPFYARGPDKGVSATSAKVSIGGHPVYGMYFGEGAVGYRNNSASGIAKGDEAETIYMVVDGKHYNDKCCFDYGNAETNSRDDGVATMEALYWGNSSGFLSHPGAGHGPWVMADLENGVWAGKDLHNPSSSSIDATYVTAMLKGKAGGFALKGGDAQSGSLKTMYEGARPWRYSPMKKQGAIILGIGGDNSYGGVGTFYEGVMTGGYASDAADDAVQANIVAAGYGH